MHSTENSISCFKRHIFKPFSIDILFRKTYETENLENTAAILMVQCLIARIEAFDNSKQFDTSS